MKAAVTTLDAGKAGDIELRTRFSASNRAPTSFTAWCAIRR